MMLGLKSLGELLRPFFCTYFSLLHMLLIDGFDFDF